MVKYDYVEVDNSRLNDAVRAYFLWKELNAIIKNDHSRALNFPEIISESLLCYTLGYKLNRGSHGDAYDEENNLIIECKACSNYDKDTSSFSPSENFDKLYFLRLYQRDDELYIYDTNYDSKQLKEIPASKTETVGEQQEQGRRPRFSVIKEIINKTELQPIAKFNIREKKIIHLE
ncbi:Bsp6I family type II restriction endonuclease [Staphylococcus xylosus]|uniref:Bsp6I family type II restriction endonuclease n=1 Tax=Staphylococcus xylosus TaxID=1288 RepID=UPI0015599BC0|nr:Bsp6I family type II restriction endonuclease [Staphylococcus xylosus]NQD97720.1 Bsp6I family type II restriction endonuclease [Staphylococcus xylosus]